MSYGHYDTMYPVFTGMYLRAAIFLAIILWCISADIMLQLWQLVDRFSSGQGVILYNSTEARYVDLELHTGSWPDLGNRRGDCSDSAVLRDDHAGTDPIDRWPPEGAVRV